MTADFTNALEGAEAVIHQAAPLPGRAESPAAQIDTAVQGSLNILRQAELAGIKKFAFASSLITVRGRLVTVRGKLLDPPQHMLTDQDWNTATRVEALDGTRDPFFVYGAEKTLQERAIWAFAEKHPHISVVTINPPFFFGPFAPGFQAPDAKLSTLSTNTFIYTLLDPTGKPPIAFGAGVDIRDVVSCLINAVTSLPNASRKRILISGEWFSWKDAVDYIAVQRPEIKYRLSVAAKEADPAPESVIDNTEARRLLGMRELTPWKITVLDAVDSLIALENKWGSERLTPV
ncbi:hypothetical protein AcV7_007478 [Taiwanofungus camphoratus]|nr:hypothetical protein AcV7_007478 [Antrodia cinnamomea]